MIANLILPGNLMNNDSLLTMSVRTSNNSLEFIPLVGKKCCFYDVWCQNHVAIDAYVDGF